ncbi:MAG: hypothetical protein JWO69_1304 [Thermoleophilia bacterium]|nr:hypothetical protein [Thermoleophilia bacterium]
MPGIRAHTADLKWPQLAEYAAQLSGRPAVVAARAADYAPAFGDLSAANAARLVRTIEDVLTRGDGSWIVPVHSTEAYYAPQMLDEGFHWKRWRDPVDGFEPHEAQLRGWQALGEGERAEDFLFAGVRPIRATGGTLAQTLESSSGAGGFSTGFGDTSLMPPSTTLANATVVPGPNVPGLQGTKAGTIEHLPALMASRIAAESGFLWDTERRVLDMVAGHEATVARALQTRSGRSALEQLLRAPSQERLDGVEHMMAQYAGSAADPLEAHLRTGDLLPVELRRVEVEPPQVTTWDRSSRGGPPNVVTHASGLIAPGRLDEIARAAAQLGVPVGGIDAQRAAYRATVDLRDLRGADAVTMWMEPDVPPVSTAEAAVEGHRDMVQLRARLAARDAGR